MDNTVNTQQETNTAESTENHTQKQEKFFTQADLDRIIGERLARVKTETNPELQAREQKCAQRELRLDARERLADAGLPKELLSAINCNTKEDMEKSITVIQNLYGNVAAGSTARNRTGTYRVSTTSSGEHSGSSSGIDDPVAIRQAMGLKG